MSIDTACIDRASSNPACSNPASSDLATRELLDRAGRTGLVTAREIADGAVTFRALTETGRSSGGAVTALELHGQPIAYGKWCASGDRAVSHEQAVLRQLTGSELVPEVVGPGGDEVLWVAAARGGRLAGLAGTTAELAEVCQAWGAAVAALHLAPSTAGAPVAPRPWLLDPDRLPRSMRSVPAGSGRALVLRTLRTDRSLLRTSSRVADRWSQRQLIHGALSADRVLARRAPDLRVCFVDLAAGGLGDPGWDLAGALVTIEELTAQGWSVARDAGLGEFFLHGYRRAGGPGTVDAGMRSLATLHRAWERAVALDARSGFPASLHPAAGHPTQATRLIDQLDRARRLAARSDRPGLVAA